ncbi:MAG: helix-turn-helix transcriptional regulator [Clostridia bacterium]|nr:helix-turn-helix transcriptional regulator [Clostridia bacterium]
MYDQSKYNCQQINELLREKRMEYGFTQQQVADYLQIDRSTYAKYENGRMPEVDVIVLICQLYMITPNELLQTFLPVKPDGHRTPVDYLHSPKDSHEITDREMELIRQFRNCRRKERVEYILAYYLWEEAHDLPE